MIILMKKNVTQEQIDQVTEWIASVGYKPHISQGVERTLIGDSVPALVRWGKHVPRAVVQRIQADGFRQVARYAAAQQKFFARKLAEHHIDIDRVRRPQDLGEVFTT